MMKTLALVIAGLLLAHLPAEARDDGGFGPTRVAQAPKALGDNTAEVLAAAKTQKIDALVAEIEPAAGDDMMATPDSKPLSAAPSYSDNVPSLGDIIRDFEERNK